MTWRSTLGDHFATVTGGAAMFGLFYQPKNDVGGELSGVAFVIPLKLNRRAKEAAQHAGKTELRIAFLCESAEQVEQIADQIDRKSLLPNHNRVPLERVEAGNWGRLF